MTSKRFSSWIRYAIIATYYSEAQIDKTIIKLLKKEGIDVKIDRSSFVDRGSKSRGQIYVKVPAHQYPSAIQILEEAGFLEEKHLHTRSNFYWYKKLNRWTNWIPLFRHWSVFFRIKLIIGVIIIMICSVLILFLPNFRNKEISLVTENSLWKVIQIRYKGENVIILREPTKFEFIKDSESMIYFDSKNKTIHLPSIKDKKICYGDYKIDHQYITISEVHTSDSIYYIGRFKVKFERGSLFLHSSTVDIICKKMDLF